MGNSIKRFVTADLHFGHSAIIDYCGRPFMSATEMDKKLISNWNSVVRQKDKVYVLGDVSFYNEEKTRKIIEQLYGYKILVMGNHDMGRNMWWWHNVGFNEVYKYPIIVDEFLVMQHEPPMFTNPSTPYYYFYGHVHATDTYKTITQKSACMCVERWDYTPVDLEKVSDLIKLL